jgi:hypothetical protein
LARWRQRIAVLVATVLSVVALASFPAPAAKADPGCIDGGVYVLWARGSGAAFNADEARAFKSHVYYALDALGVTRHEWAELGNLDGYPGRDNRPNDPAEYPAVAVNDWNVTNVFSEGYRNSVTVGIDELVKHLNHRYKPTWLGGRGCFNETVILGGYSQGADVIGYALKRSGGDENWSLRQDAKNRIGYVALYGDPRFNIACNQDVWWVRGNPNCNSYSIFETRNPYAPAELRGWMGSWCDKGDGLCAGSFEPGGTHGEGNHGTVYRDWWIWQSAAEIANQARYWLKILSPLGSGGTSGSSGYVNARSTGGTTTPPPPPPPPTGSSPIKNGGFNASTAHWSAYGTANLARYTMADGKGANPYEGAAYLASNASQPGDSVAQTNAVTISAGDTWCASAEAVTLGAGPGSSGTLALWLLGGSNDVSTYRYENLPGSNNWQAIKTCVMATGSRSQVKVQFYPDPGSPTVGLDAVDVHQTLNTSGGFNNGNSYWNLMPSTNLATYATTQNVGTNAYEGSAFAATNTALAGGGFLQDMPRNIAPGDTFCAEAQVVTVGNATGGAGALALFLTGGATEQSVAYFNNLPGNSNWMPVKTCVTATAAHTNLRVQLYPSVNGPTVGVDALDVHASIAQNGGLNGDSQHWSPGGSLGYMNYANYNGTQPSEGSGFEVLQTNQAGASLWQARNWGWGAGDTFCAEAKVVTAGGGNGAGGTLALWLLRPNGSDVSTYSFSALPGGNNWTRIKTCVQASAGETYGTIKVQLYPSTNNIPLGVDAVDVH